MQEAASTVEREGRRPAVPFAPGNPGGPGRPKGMPNKVTRTIREAVMESIEPGNCHPDGLAGWLIERARGGIEDRKIYAAVVSRVIPIEITGENGGPVKIDLGWLTGRKVGGEVIDITPTTQTLADQALTRLPTDFQSEAPAQAQSQISHTNGGEAATAGGVPDLLSNTQAQAPAPMVAKPAKSKARKGASE
jgi:hypothetical protein